MAENTDLSEATNGSFNVPDQQSETQPPPQAPGTSTGAAGAGNDGDALDKGVDFLERKAGHEQSHSTTEKISDGFRKGFKKMTGKDVPVQDKTYS